MSVEYTWRDENGQIQPEPNPYWVIFPSNDLNEILSKLTSRIDELERKFHQLLNIIIRCVNERLPTK